jgi:glycosyltransferase involved in cell wall biosynthesis
MNFSVVTPNLNMARFLPQTIDSVLRNLRPGDEYFVIDGGSTDGSSEIIRGFDNELSGWTTEKDRGYADAVAKGFAQATGDYMCWVNSGDLLVDGALDLARETLSSSGADLLFGDDVMIDEEGNILAHSRADVKSLRFMMLFGGWTPLQDACFWRRELYERIGGLDPSLLWAADYDFFLRASVNGRCHYVPRVLSAFRRHQGQKSVSAADAYEVERQFVRRRVLTCENAGLWTRLMLEPPAWIAVRWRHHVRRRFIRSDIPLGSPVRELSVSQPL